MDERSHRIGQLIVRQLQQELSEEERQELDAWRMEAPENQVLWEELSDSRQVAGSLDQFYRYDLTKGRAKIGQSFPGLHPSRRIQPFRRWLVAASIILLIGIGLFFLVRHFPHQPPVALQSHDIAAPGANRARITLADGQTVDLDSIGNGPVAMQGNVQLVKLADGQIAYDPSTAGGKAAEVVYNTVTNPRGSRVIHITLSDGSQVWLNAESSLRYPTVFTGGQRAVEISGEAYLEVTSNASQPFTVKKDDAEVLVLGTRFNINAYEEEKEIRVTLLEGSVKVVKGNSSGLLQPGQQAQVQQSVKVVSGVDLNEVMAWKNGLFRFNQTDIQTVMRQISRWYDVEVSYPQGIPKDTYWGALQRDLRLSSVFKVLQESGAHFTIDGKKVIVLP